MPQLGRSGISVSPLCLGGNVFGWTIDEAQSFRVLDAFVDAGMNFIDTADVYAIWQDGSTGGESETIIGKWMKARGNRERLVIATKVGMDMGGDKKGLSAKRIFEAVEESLSRLQIDHIDLYQSHRDDPDTPQEETLGAFARLIEQGKVRTIGASNYSAERLSEALRISEAQSLPRYECLQPLYNLYDREDFEHNLEKLVLAEGIAVIPYFSLGAGFLTGKYRSEADLVGSHRGGRVKRYLNDRGYRILAALDHVADEHNSTPARVALAWLIARPSITAPIASATSLAQMVDLIEATRLQLTVEELELLNVASWSE